MFYFSLIHVIVKLVILRAPMRPKQSPKADHDDLFRSRLDHIINMCSAPGSLDTSLSHAAGLIEIAACHA